jgi:hypothetical protein
MPDRFDEEILGRLHKAREVSIETSRGAGAPLHRAVIWVVVDSEGRVLIRSYRGATARWFRETVGNPAVALVLDGNSIAATALVATDNSRIEAANRGYIRKYPKAGGLSGMLADEVLGTTLEIIPR